MIISLFVIPNPLIDTYVNRHMGGSDGSSSRQFNMFHSTVQSVSVLGIKKHGQVP